MAQAAEACLKGHFGHRQLRQVEQTVSLAVRQADAAAAIPSNPHRKVIIPLLYSLATLPIAAL